MQFLRVFSVVLWFVVFHFDLQPLIVFLPLFSRFCLLSGTRKADYLTSNHSLAHLGFLITRVAALFIASSLRMQVFNVHKPERYSLIFKPHKGG